MTNKQDRLSKKAAHWDQIAATFQGLSADQAPIASMIARSYDALVSIYEYTQQPPLNIHSLPDTWRSMAETRRRHAHNSSDSAKVFNLDAAAAAEDLADEWSEVALRTA